MHTLLERQLKRHVGSIDSIPKKWKSFVEAVNEAYLEADADRTLLERSLELASEELVEKNQQLQKQVMAEQVRARLAEAQSLALIETLYSISQGLNKAQDEDELLQILAWPALEAGAIAGNLIYIELNDAGEPEWAEIVAAWKQEGQSVTPAGTRLYLPETPFSRLWLASLKEPQLISDVTTDERVDKDVKPLLAQISTRATAIIPLIQTGLPGERPHSDQNVSSTKRRWEGVITFNWDEPHQFSQQETAIYEALISLVSPAVATRRLMDNLEQIVEMRTAALQGSLQERERLQQEVIEAQKRAIQELSTPIIPVMERIIVIPLIGSIDSMRARDITRSLLAGISEHRAKVVILDITGVPLVDSGIANHLNKTIQAARLKGARTIVTGISDAVAETIVDLGIDWSEITTLSNLQTGLTVALGSLGLHIGGRK
jgi:anti-anti-sigma regulatory factor